jgi:hypothetical protein
MRDPDVTLDSRHPRRRAVARTGPALAAGPESLHTAGLVHANVRPENV